MQLSIIPKNYIINVPVETGGKIISNFLLHGLKIKNDYDHDMILNSINFELYDSNQLVKEITYQNKSLEEKIIEYSKLKGLEDHFVSGLYFGEKDYFHSLLTTKTLSIKSGQETGIFNEYFIIVHNRLIEELTIKVSYTINDKTQVEEMRISLIQYHCKNDYIFPLKGSISTVGNFNSLIDHRQHYSMEFAFDMSKYNHEQKLCFKENMKDADYTVYGEEVYAIADGEVVDCYHSFDMTSSWDYKIRKPYIDQYGLAAQCGNFIVIKHNHNEYSFYGHLLKDSLTVNKGDILKQGQIIARVGNTGLSNCPHLHFQLMNGPYFLSSRGLPCSFSNIKDVAGNRITFIEEENVIVHTD